MRFDTTLAGFQSRLGDMASAQSRIQSGFARMLDKENPPTQDESVDFTSAFVEEDFAARLAEAQLKILKAQDEMLETMIDIKSDPQS